MLWAQSATGDYIRAAESREGARENLKQEQGQRATCSNCFITRYKMLPEEKHWTSLRCNAWLTKWNKQNRKDMHGLRASLATALNTCQKKQTFHFQLHTCIHARTYASSVRRQAGTRARARTHTHTHTHTHTQPMPISPVYREDTM